jgi:hypothetical protein
MTVTETPNIAIAGTLTDIDGVEYPFICTCGEQYTEIWYAATCRKCRYYSLGERCLYVIDDRTGEIVWGREPTDEETARYEAQAELVHQETLERIAMLREEGELYEALMAETWKAEARAERELAEDILYDIQDMMMGAK